MRALGWFTIGAMTTAAGYIAVVVVSTVADRRHLAALSARYDYWDKPA